MRTLVYLTLALCIAAMPAFGDMIGTIEEISADSLNTEFLASQGNVLTITQGDAVIVLEEDSDAQSSPGQMPFGLSVTLTLPSAGPPATGTFGSGTLTIGPGGDPLLLATIDSLLLSEVIGLPLLSGAGALTITGGQLYDPQSTDAELVLLTWLGGFAGFDQDFTGETDATLLVTLPTPEPITLGMLALGGVALLACRRK
ncbi:MAG: PEP-CTERM sorting domain-containing protein [Planctomycetota bacterium]|jgi:hypothetical protein